VFDRKLIETFAQGGQQLREAVAGLSREQLVAFPVPGTWSIQQIVVHLMDSDAVAVDRMKRIAAMSNPLLIGYDETAYIEKLSPHEMSLGDCVSLFDLNRRLMADILRRLPDEAFAQTGVHNEVGKVTLGGLVESYIKHLDHHLAFIRKKRAMV
jgi:uncharacterized damage-inducible protein DinB